MEETERPANGSGGGGSGGSIWINVGTLSGLGRIKAVGGNAGDALTGSGGGGRIAVFYDALDFSRNNISAAGGTDGNPGSPGTVLLADRTQDFRTKSTVDEFIVLSPAGNIPFKVTLKDQSGSLVVGSVDVWLEFIDVDGLTKCPSQIEDQILPLAPSDSAGNVWFSVKRGGCSSDLLKVKTSQGLIAQVPIKSLDHNGGLLVTAGDFVGDACNDYNNDGVTNGQDFDFFVNYLGQTCIVTIADYINAEVFTLPDLDHIFTNDTISLCSRYVNRLDEAIKLDTAVFSTSLFGIALPWTQFAMEPYGGVVAPHDTLQLCKQFIITSAQHGCFEIASKFSLVTTVESKPHYGFTHDRYVNLIPPSADLRCRLNIDPEELCNLMPKGSTSTQIHNVQIAQNVLEGTEVDDTNPAYYETRVVLIGNEYGDSLYLHQFSFLPNGWSCTFSDTGWIHTPDTINVIIKHDSIVSCQDTARVFLYAYTNTDEYVGYVEVDCHLLGTRGDINYDRMINEVDVAWMDSLLYFIGWKYRDSIELGVANLNNDNRIDIADVTRLVDYLYVSHEPFVCARDTGYVGPKISIATSYMNDTTTIYLTSPIDLKGLQLELIGLKNVTPENLLGDSIGIAHGSLDSLHRVGLFDFSGGSVINSGTRKVIRIPGAITILSARASDQDHHSLPVTTSRAVAAEIRAGWNMVSNPMTRLVNTDSVKQLFPSSLYPHVFTYDQSSGYKKRYNLTNGVGYWGKFSGSATEFIVGEEIASDSIDVLEGWNMIGSISKPVLATSIASDPPGMVTSDFFKYRGSYLPTDTISPGYGYWVKVNQAGKLILNATLSASVTASRIKIVPTSELPPSPPEENGEVNVLPKEYVLEQNYPNPFNPITTIKYGLPFPSNVKLKLFNVLGQVVATLKDEEESAGYKQIEWNSSTVASGIYFYRLEAMSVSDPSKSFIQVKKLVVLK